MKTGNEKENKSEERKKNKTKKTTTPIKHVEMKGKKEKKRTLSCSYSLKSQYR